MLRLFCDGSVNPQKKIGFAAYFILEENESLDSIKNRIHLKKFENTSSTKLELQALLWALDDEKIKNTSAVIYTDCQNILGLEKRRNKLEKNDYFSSSGKLINNHELYKNFYTITDELDCSFIKVEGHKKTSLKDSTDKLFNLVDKESRKALRKYLSNE